MTEAQKADSTEARQASMSRVQTQETILAKLGATEAAKEPPEVKTEGEQGKEGEGDQKPKKGPSERIQELVKQRKEAEAKADAAERKASELEAQVQALSVKAKPIEVNPRPQRSQYATEDEYIDAVGDWRADQKIAKREAEQEQARMEAVERDVQTKWDKQQTEVMKQIPDFADVVGKAETPIPQYLVQAIRKSAVGAHILYFLSLHSDEAKAYAALDPIDGVKRFRDLERDMADMEKADDPKAEDTTPTPKKSKAPPPIEPVKSVPSSSGSSSNSYEEYKRRRQAGK